MTCFRLKGADRSPSVSLLVLLSLVGAILFFGTLATGAKASESEYAPHFIWWWPGNAVEDAELRLEAEQMAEAGAGGFQTIATYGRSLPPEGNPPETFEYGTPKWAGHFRTVLEAAQEHGLEADLQISANYPWTSPVAAENLEYSTQQLGFGSKDLAGPSEFVGPPPSAGLSPEAELVAVTAAKRDPAGEDPQGRLLLDVSTVVDLTSTLDEEGNVHWSVPAGEWVLFGFWQDSTHSVGSGCDLPESCVNTGLTIDHMSRAATDAATEYLDEHLFSELGELPEQVGGVLHEDSLEAFGARVLWTGEFLAEFELRRGYDLTKYLPALSVPEGAEEGLKSIVYDFGSAVGERIRHDYAQTLTELWVENNITPTSEWAQTHGMGYSGRAFGTDYTGLETLAVDRAYDVPDVDHITNAAIDWVTTASSAAHLSGSRITTAEVGDLAFKDQMITFDELKRLGDRMLSGGANRLEFHIFPYQHAAGAAWPSWSPWSSEFLPFGVSEGWSPKMPQWSDFPKLNGYFTRAQKVLQRGRPVNDVAIYRDMQGSNGGADGFFTGDILEPLVNSSLTGAGFTFDAVDPGTITDPATHVENERLIMERPRYRGLVVDLEASTRRGQVDSSDAISAAVAEQLVSFGEAGLPIVFVGQYPDRGVSYDNAGAEDAVVNEAVAALEAMPNVALASDPMEAAETLEGLEVRPNLSLSGVSAEPVQCGLGAPCVYNVHRRTPKGDYWFIWNAGSTPVSFTGSFRASPERAPSSLDLWNGGQSPIGLYKELPNRINVPIELAAEESTVIAFRDPIEKHVVSTDAESVVARNGKLFLRSTQAGEATATLSDESEKAVSFGTPPSPLTPSQWDLHVDGALPEGTETHDLELTELEDWREIPEIESTSGTGTYVTNLTLGSSWIGSRRGAYLELGQVEGGSVSVFVNGELVTDAVVPSPRLDVRGFLQEGSNEIKVVLRTTLKNRLFSLSSEPGYMHFAERPELTQAYGLLGPVNLVPYRDRRVG